MPITASIAKEMSLSKTELFLRDNINITTLDGLSLTLSKHEQATANKDDKQFILTYDVDRYVEGEKIYDVKSQTGEIHQVFMAAINDNQLQAVFNWRLNA